MHAMMKGAAVSAVIASAAAFTPPVALPALRGSRTAVCAAKFPQQVSFADGVSACSMEATRTWRRVLLSCTMIAWLPIVRIPADSVVPLLSPGPRGRACR